jgi:serine/threonine protein kinase
MSNFDIEADDRRTESIVKKARTKTQKFTRNTTLRTTEIITRQSFDIVKKLGDGAYGVVYLVKKKDTGQLFALKELEKEHILRYNK